MVLSSKYYFIDNWLPFCNVNLVHLTSKVYQTSIWQSLAIPTQDSREGRVSIKLWRRSFYVPQLKTVEDHASYCNAIPWFKIAIIHSPYIKKFSFRVSRHLNLFLKLNAHFAFCQQHPSCCLVTLVIPC